MKSVSLTAYPRTLVRRRGVKKLRATARIPAVIYGRKTNPQNLEVNLKELKDLMHESASENLLVDLTVSGESAAVRLALLQEVQHHPLSGKVLHVDFHEVAENEKVTITVPVEAVGEATGVKNSGGVLEHVLFKLKVRGLPKDLPEVIHVDVSHLNIGQAVHIGDIPAPPGVEIVGDKAISVIAVAAPVTEAQEAAAEAAAAAGPVEPEVLKEKKEGEEEGKEAAPAPKAAKEPAKEPAEKTVEKTVDKAADKKAEKKR